MPTSSRTQLAGRAGSLDPPPPPLVDIGTSEKSLTMIFPVRGPDETVGLIKGQVPREGVHKAVAGPRRMRLDTARAKEDVNSLAPQGIDTVTEMFAACQRGANTSLRRSRLPSKRCA